MQWQMLRAKVLLIGNHARFGGTYHIWVFLCNGPAWTSTGPFRTHCSPDNSWERCLHHTLMAKLGTELALFGQTVPKGVASHGPAWTSTVGLVKINCCPGTTKEGSLCTFTRGTLYASFGLLHWVVQAQSPLWLRFREVIFERYLFYHFRDTIRDKILSVQFCFCSNIIFSACVDNQYLLFIENKTKCYFMQLMIFWKTNYSKTWLTAAQWHPNWWAYAVSPGLNELVSLCSKPRAQWTGYPLQWVLSSLNGWAFAVVPGDNKKSIFCSESRAQWIRDPMQWILG